jgi:protease I
LIKKECAVWFGAATELIAIAQREYHTLVIGNTCYKISSEVSNPMKRLGFLAIVTLLIASLPSNVYAQSNREGSGAQIVMVVAQADFTDQEYFETKRIFDKAKVRVAVASIEKGFATSHDGARIWVDTAINKLTPDQFDAIVIVGGMGVIGSLSNSQCLRDLLIAAYNTHKVVAAICIAPIVLAKAGLLRNRQATCFSAEPIINELRRSGAIYKNEEVLQAEGIITANGPNASTAFAKKIIEELGI